jgi:hypothetical protein
MTTKISSSILSLSRIFTRPTYFIKRFVSTTMASSNEVSSNTAQPDKKRENLLAKRFYGSEKNIW